MESWERWDKAMQKAAEPNFTLANNPLVRPLPEVMDERRVNANMRALERDAAKRNDPVRGQSYSEIMNMRYGGA